MSNRRLADRTTRLQSSAVFPVAASSTEDTAYEDQTIYIQTVRRMPIRYAALCPRFFNP